MFLILKILHIYNIGKKNKVKLKGKLQGVKQNDMEVKVGNLSVNCLLCSDDAVLIESLECELQALVTTLKEECGENNGIILNASKTKVLVFERI